jgi:hypothetical protein
MAYVVDKKAALRAALKEMPRGGIEPPTPAFSVLCSTD